MNEEAPKASRDVLELRQQVKALECRLAALEDKGKPQPDALARSDRPAYEQEIHQLRQRVKNLESRFAAIEPDSLRNGTAPVVPSPPPLPNTTVPKPADGANEKPVIVGHIIIVGNTKTEDGAIRKKVPLRPATPSTTRPCARPRRTWRPSMRQSTSSRASRMLITRIFG